MTIPAASLSVLEMLERDPEYMAAIRAIEARASTLLSVKQTAAYLG